MTAHTLMAKLAPFKDKPLLTSIDEITAIAKSLRFYVNIRDPDFNVSPIMDDPKRLNVRTDRDGLITSFTIG